LAGHSAKKKQDWQHILVKNMIGSTFCETNMIGSTFWEKIWLAANSGKKQD
jgi:hypothetical protein